VIPKKTVQQILETAKVEDVIQDFVNLKRRGVNLLGLCPFHHEKTPSFTVSPTKNIFKCFGCGVGGDAVKFVMEHEKFTYPEALRYLAKKYRIEIEEFEMTPEMLAEQQLEESLYIVNEYARKYYADNLFLTDVGKSVGLNYFKERGFREETIKKFGLGFASGEKDAFTKKATTEGYKIDLLKKLGLTTQYDRDFFRNRVLFTIRNLSGKVIAFAGRILVKDVKAPKYINSPETEIYNKSKALYGAFFAKRAIRKADECILVEGYTDVISLHQAGIENVVASSGTSLTEGQIGLIKRFTPNIKILYDGDPAGVKAALRGLDMALEKNLNVKVVLLPEGEDPDSYLQQVGVTAFKEYIRGQAQDFILFKTNLLLAEVAGDPVKRTALVKDIVSSIAKIPDPIKRSLYVKECAKVMEIEEQVLVNEMNKMVRQILKKKRTENERKLREQERQQEQGETLVEGVMTGLPEPDVELLQPGATQKLSVRDEFQERDIIRLLIASGGEVFDEKENISVAEYILSNIEEVLDDFDNQLFTKIAKHCLEMLVNKNPLNPSHFINHKDLKISALAIDLLHSPYEYSPGWEERYDIYLTTQKMPELNFTKDSLSALLRFKLRKIIRMCEKNQQRLKELKADGDTTQMLRIIKVQTKLNEIRDELARQFGTVVLR